MQTDEDISHDKRQGGTANAKDFIQALWFVCFGGCCCLFVCFPPLYQHGGKQHWCVNVFYQTVLGHQDGSVELTLKNTP